MRLPLLCLALACCGGEPRAERPIKFLHTFNPRETELFNTTIAERGLHVDASLVPFARGHQVIEELLRGGHNCPDLIRIDATWLPGLVASKLIIEPPAELALGWAAIAKDLAVVESKMWALPQSIDGLVVVRLAGTPAPAPESPESPKP